MVTLVINELHYQLRKNCRYLLHSMLVIGVGCTRHTWDRAQVKVLKVVDFSNKVNKISNMTL